MCIYIAYAFYTEKVGENRSLGGRERILNYNFMEGEQKYGCKGIEAKN